jgi:hypothetical protein
VFILTIPGFNWFPVAQSNQTSPGPRSYHSCDLVGNRQALLFGGVAYENKTTLEIFRGGAFTTDPLTQGIGIFDMSTLTWSDSYDANAPRYEQPQIVADWYASANPDSVDWTSDKLRALFEDGNTIWSSGNGSSSTNVGAIAGGVVGGVIGIVLIGLLIWFYTRRRRGLPLFGGRPDPEKDTSSDKYTLDGPSELKGNPYTGPSELDGKAGVAEKRQSLGELPSPEASELPPMESTQPSELPQSKPAPLHELP